MTDLEKQFKIRLHDPFDWIYSAKKHLISAKCIEKRMFEIIKVDPDLNNENTNLEFQALKNSCLFLVGIGLENAIKGYIVAQKPNFKNTKEMRELGWGKLSGHGISEMYKINCFDIYTSNNDFLERIQEYLIWIGKYSTPMRPENLILSNEYFVDDVGRASTIISKIEEMIEKMELPYYHDGTN